MFKLLKPFKKGMGTLFQKIELYPLPKKIYTYCNLNPSKNFVLKSPSLNCLFCISCR